MVLKILFDFPWVGLYVFPPSEPWWKGILVMEQKWARSVQHWSYYPSLCGLLCSFPSGSDGGTMGSFFLNLRLRLWHWKKQRGTYELFCF